MSRYRVYVSTTISTSFEVETDETDPREIADAALEGMDTPSLCHYCVDAMGDDVGDWNVVHSGDGTPWVERVTER